MTEDRRIGSADRRGGIFEMLDHNNQQNKEKHTRLRGDLTELEVKVATLTKTIGEHEVELEVLKNRKTEASELHYSSKLIVAIAITAFALGASQWLSLSGVKASMKDTIAAVASVSEKVESQSKLQEERGTNLRTAIDEMKRRVELQQFQINEMRDMIVKQQYQNGVKK